MSSDKNDPLLITEHELLYSIKERVEGVLSFYDYEAHKSLFSLLKPIRKALENQKSILTDDTTELLSDLRRYT